MKQVAKAIQLKKELDLLRPLTEEDESRIMQKFRLDWNYHSNNLEGNSLSYGETKALILFGITAQGKPLKDHFEITGHDEAIKEVIEVVQQERPLTENLIRELHKLILKESYEVDAITPNGQPTKKRVNVGVYKTTANHVKTKTGEIFRFATPEETPALMHDLIQWYRVKAKEQDIEPILLASEFHYKFIRIHPFDDGNGRTARILMNFILMQFGYPPVIIKTEDKENYFAALRQGDAGLLEPFVEYIAQNLVRSLEIMIKGAKGKAIEEEDDLDKEIALLERKVKAIGQTISIAKNQESILEIYDNTIKRLVVKFISRCKQFEQFYVSSEFSLWVNKHQQQISDKGSELNIMLAGRQSVDGSTKVITIVYEYLSFKQSEFDEFNYSSIIRFQFDNTKYITLASQDGPKVERFYGEQLIEHDIDQIVKAEIRKHKEFIEQKIKQIESKK